MTSATDELLVDALADLQAFEEERDDIQSRDLEAISLAWSGLLREAIDGRRESGIEDVWLKAEEAYIGMDDANRAEFGRAMWCKPMSIHGPLQQNDDGKSDQQRQKQARPRDRFTSIVCNIFAHGFRASRPPVSGCGTPDTSSQPSCSIQYRCVPRRP